MLFNTINYAIFFAIAFTGSWALSRVAKGWARIVFLLVLSYGFYAAGFDKNLNWNFKYLPLIFASSTVDFFLARAIDRMDDPKRRKALLAITVILNLGFLGFFKYWNFAIENVNVMRAWWTGAPVSGNEALKVLLPPVGISFFTFESMSYVIDVYRRELKPHKSYIRYLLFVSFFPHLVAGPIVRPRDLLPQFEAEPKLTREDGGEGLFLIAVGLIKKIVISDQLSLQLVDRVFELPQNYSSLEVLAGVYGYAVQIYCDFSGYTDIAIGSALLLGVRFPLNFDSPYKAHNLQDFWRRWHISLSTWLRDYLYIPLGGNRGSSLRTYFNLMATMVLGGLWHGASWNFVLWGFLHGGGLAVTRAFQRESETPIAKKAEKNAASGESENDAVRVRVAREPTFARRAIGVFFTFHYVCIAWIFFRATTFKKAKAIFQQLWLRTTNHANLPPILLTVLGVGLVFHFWPEKWFQSMKREFTALPAVVQGIFLFGVCVVLHEAASAQAVPFIYFQF
ncbi:MAG: MBOAT family protein [Polyangiaceae bacterium]|nr:MBOAT family protein [Polyangiaceae bacterium]